MRKAAVALAVVGLVGCASGRSAKRAEPPSEVVVVQAPPGADSPAAAAPAPRSSPQAVPSVPGATFVDSEHGFEIRRPDDSWLFKSGQDLSSEAITVPLVIANEHKGAQVVVQVAPAVATPSQFAERLTVGLKDKAGFEISEVQPIPLADGAVGFDFAVADQVHGKVAILEGAEGRVYVLLATWPEDAPVAVEQDVDRIMGSLKTVQ